jgi:hypothetical protein
MQDYVIGKVDFRGLKCKISNTLLEPGVYKQIFFDFMYKWEIVSNYYIILITRGCGICHLQGGSRGNLNRRIIKC